MKQKVKKYSADFKFSVVRDYLNSGRSQEKNLKGSLSLQVMSQNEWRSTKTKDVPVDSDDVLALRKCSSNFRRKFNWINVWDKTMMEKSLGYRNKSKNL